jgi:purine-cytosine permease-like protein
LSYLPTVLNVAQRVGWATFEIVVIAEAASRALGTPRWPFALAPGVLATVMAVRPLREVSMLARYAVWLALAAIGYLFVQVLAHPLPAFTEGGASSFWTAVDIATVALFLGVLALGAYGKAGLDVVGALLAVPPGVVAVVVLLVVEVGEAFANVFSTAVSAQNFAARLDRRVLAVIVGVVSTVLAFTFGHTSYEAFLFLIGAVFVPLVWVFVVAYQLMRGRAWDVSDTAPAGPLLLLAWAAGFVAYQLTLPTYFEGTRRAGWTAWWTARRHALGIDTNHGWLASLVSLAVAMVLTALSACPE